MNTTKPTYDVRLRCGHICQVLDAVPADQRHLYPNRGTSNAICNPCWIDQSVTDAIGVCQSRKLGKHADSHLQTYQTLRGVRSASRWIDARKAKPVTSAAAKAPRKAKGTP